MHERTLVLIKPDAVERGLADDILGVYAREGLEVVARREVRPSAETVDAHYATHVGRDYYPALREYMLSGPLVAVVLEGPDAVATARRVNGATSPEDADEGTIRKMYGIDKRHNSVHASEDADAAARETGIWFPEGV